MLAATRIVAGVRLCHPARRGLNSTLGAPRTHLGRTMASAADAGTWRGDSDAEPALRQMLTSRGVDVSRWGTGNAKSVAHLLEEVTSNETTLRLDDKTNAVTRELHVMQVAVRDPRHQDRVLVEASQILPDGRERRREVLLAEKMIAGEPWQDAAMRGIAEELGSILGDVLYVRLKEDTHSVRTASHESPSYPGLATQYTIHRVDADVEGLPTEVDSFTTEEPRAGGKQLVTHWEWRRDIPPDKWFGYA